MRFCNFENSLTQILAVAEDLNSKILELSTKKAKKKNLS